MSAPARSGRWLANAGFWLAALIWAAALAVGGGPGWRGERLLVFPALLLICLSAWLFTQSVQQRDARATRVLWGPPSLLLLVPLLQCLPLPWSLWSQLPGREALASDLAQAGAGGGWHALSLAPAQTESAFMTLLIPCALYMAAMSLPGAQRRVLLRIGLAAAAVNVFVGLLQLAQGPDSALYVHEYTNHDDAVGLFANRNHLASFLASVVPVSLGALMDRLRHATAPERDLRVWGLIALLLLLAIGATATRSRIGFAMLLLSLLAGALVAWRARRQSAAGRRALVWLPLGTLLALALVLQFTLTAFVQRVQADQAEDLRWRLARETLQLAAPAWGTGFGIGSYARVHDLLGDAAAQTYAYVNHAHDDYLELWLEGGVPAVLLALLALAWIARQLRRQWRAQSAGPAPGAGAMAGAAAAPRDPHRGLKLGAAAALALLAIHSAVDYPLRTLALQCHAALLAALLAAGTGAPGAGAATGARA